MKKIYLIVTLLFSVMMPVIAQNPNNHWQLGATDVNFTTNLPITAVSGNANQYGKASISDDNGNLLFYTDGKTVWNKNHSVMTNGGNLGYSGVLNTIIVPNLANPNQFYIFRSEEKLCLCLYRMPMYYLYSIVEFNSLNPLGILLPFNSNPLVGSLENQYSKVLSDSLGIVENALSFGALTSTKNNNDTAFWVIVQNKNKLLSYKIDSSGLNTVPVESTFTNAQIYQPGTENSGVVSGLEETKFKIAPNNSFLIGLQYSKANNQYDPDSNFLNFRNFFYKTNFNSTTGVFSGYESFSPGIVVNNFEISAQSNNLYFVRNKFAFSGPSYVTDVVDGEICVKDLTNSSNPIRILNEYGSTIATSKFSYLQRDKYDNLFISSIFTTSSRNLYLHKIENQNSYSGSSAALNAISLNGNSISVLPELIPSLILPCVDNVVITANVTSGTDKKQASNTIKASNTINSDANAIYHAGTSVTLTSGFNAKSGSTFRAYIAGCTNTFTQKKTSSNEEVIISERPENPLKLYPNPNAGIFTIDFGFDNKKEIEIGIYDILGKQIYHSVAKNSTIDVSLPNIPSGVYIIKLAGSGYSDTVKFVKE
nr:T9SS type A sorting domain-containing protein [uncultured Flavobacterium sp.]